MRLFMITIIVLSMCAFSRQGIAAEFPTYELSVRISPEDRILNGRAMITVSGKVKPYIEAEGLVINTLIIDGREYTPSRDALNVLETDQGEHRIEIRYSAAFDGPLGEGAVTNIGVVQGNIIDPSGTMLQSGWYPSLAGNALFTLTVELPAEYSAISEGDSVAETVSDETKTLRFDFPHPVDGIHLIAGKYERTSHDHNGVTINTYFFAEDNHLAPGYIEHTKRYLDLYRDLIGPLPYKTFSIVENRYQTGYSLPTFTLLGSRVIRLPFIVETSLGHEILHQWFGNYVYVDYEKGNWAEGLTTYLADHWYKHLEGKGMDYRKKIMLDYMNYVSEKNETGLSEFIGRQDLSSKAVGYGKATMVFHMLRKRLGDDGFFTALRNFVAQNDYKKASWNDLKTSFEQAGDLDDFFAQWIEKKGVPSVTIRNISTTFRNGIYVTSFDLVQGGTPYSLDVPVEISTSEGSQEIILHLDKQTQSYEQPFRDRPVEIVIDRNYDIMRKLAVSESPPVISSFLGDKENIVVIPGDTSFYQEFADVFAQEGYTVKAEGEVRNDDIRKHSLLILSKDNRIYGRLFAYASFDDAGAVLATHKNPLNSSKAIILMDAKNAGEVAGVATRIFRYGNYSLLTFEAGRVISKDIAESDRGIVRDLGIVPEIVDTRSITDIDTVVGNIHDRDAVFVGEMHTAYSHHVMQYEIIRRLFDRKGSLVIGMEMFQSPFQEFLDAYIRGEIDEKEFLKKSEYFTRWKFDYTLYRDIFHFAREKGIPVIALNLKKEIIEKVSKEGIDALTEEECAEIPSDLDMTNMDYRRSMKSVFRQHATRGDKDFENFFQSQILWDETMAHNTVRAMERYPDTQVVVLAGNGHLRYSWGIPDRVRRLSGASTAVILNGGGNDISESLADYILFPPHIDTPPSPKFGVYLSERDGAVRIDKVIDGSPADKAGLKKDDTIVSIDGGGIEDIPDLKISLLDRKKGDVVSVIIVRPRFILDDKEIKLDVTL